VGEKPSVFFSNLVVLPDFRGKGVCRKMIRTIIDEGWDRLGTFSEKACAEVAIGNPILPFYQKLGLEVVDQNETGVHKLALGSLKAYLVEGNFYDCVLHYGVNFRERLKR
jgi:GNAT superfamily N-acetyltransferase